MLINGKRALAYVATLDEVKPIEGYDRVVHGRTSGWWCVISKLDNLEVGDKIVYFEVDSKVPETEQFEFLSNKHYKIKTQRLCKVLSQGLIMPLRKFPQFDYDKTDVGTDLTDALKVTYADEEDNARKSNGNPNSKYESMKSRKPKIFKKKWAKWMMKRAWGRKVMFFFFGKKKDNPRGFPTFISKTDEERIENQPWRLGTDVPYFVTEKLDGTSCTYALERKGKNKFEFYVCSRNVRQKDETQSCYHDHNIYWDLAFKYNIEQHLKDFLNEYHELKWVCIQGEGVGSVQGNPLKLEEDDLYVFNFIESLQGRWDSECGKRLVEGWGMKWVPILGVTTLPETMEEMKLLADGASMVNPNVIREGLVYRSLDGKDSFKNVSNQFLMSKNK
jgi:hypothetical protein